MSRLSKSQVIRRYYLYRATARPGFHYAIYTFFLLFNGLSYTQIGLIASIQSIVVVASEVPTGYVGDRIGRRNSLAVGAAILLVSNASYLVATDLIGFTFTFVTLSFGGTFISGSASAWLYDTLQEHDSADEFTRISGRGRAIGLYVGAVGVVLGAVLYTVDRSYPFVAGIVTAALAAAFVLRLPQNEAYDDSAAVEQDRMSVADALPVITDQLTTPGCGGSSSTSRSSAAPSGRWTCGFSPSPATPSRRRSSRCCSHSPSRSPPFCSLAASTARSGCSRRSRAITPATSKGCWASGPPSSSSPPPSPRRTSSRAWFPGWCSPCSSR
nr:MFS transporter [Halobacterium salinarum]